jgi:hypothetical protein
VELGLPTRRKGSASARGDPVDIHTTCANCSTTYISASGTVRFAFRVLFLRAFAAHGSASQSTLCVVCRDLSVLCESCGNEFISASGVR